MFNNVALVLFAVLSSVIAVPVARAPVTHTGQATFFTPGLGACGKTNTASQHIVALGHQLFDAQTPGGNPNKNPLCGKTVTASFNGKTTTATIVDRCVGCAEFDLDFSPAAFKDLAAESVGRLSGVKWHVN